MTLTPDLAKLLAASFALGLVISYAWWTRLRVIFFRQDLFAIRDKLWTEAKKANALSDPVYQETRDLLNATIAGAAFLSLPSILYSLRRSSKNRRLTSANKCSIREEVEAAKVAAVVRIVRYVLWDRPFSGMVLSVLLLPIYGGWFFVSKMTAAWVKSDWPFFLSDIAART